MTWQVTVLTLFPEMFPGPLAHSLTGKALEKEIWKLKTVNIRDFSHLKHQKVDDKPFGGGNGLIMRPDIVDKALEHAVSKAKNPRPIYLTPKGKTFNQKMAQEWMKNSDQELIFLCGRYEGIDERVITHWREKGLLEVSVGDFVLSGGEIAAMMIIDTCLRLLEGVLKNQETLYEESFFIEELEYPQYTQPRVWKDKSVPEVLLSGHHREIALWRKSMAKQETKLRRPDLLGDEK